MMKYWTTGQAPLRGLANISSIKLLDVPFGSIVEATGEEVEMPTRGRTMRWMNVIYQASARSYEGWMYAGYLEAYAEEFTTEWVAIPNQTPNPNDAAQYMIWKGQVQFNLCGELCVCYCCNENLEDLLTKWQAKNISTYQRVFGSGGRARTTGLGDLQNMLDVFDNGYDDLGAALTDPVLNRALVTPGRMAELIKHQSAIVGVKIDGATGNLRGGGIGHWVAVVSVVPDGINRGWVTLYNPFPNRMQKYSWDEFVKSMGSPYGLLVK